MTNRSQNSLVSVSECDAAKLLNCTQFYKSRDLNGFKDSAVRAAKNLTTLMNEELNTSRTVDDSTHDSCAWNAFKKHSMTSGPKWI